MLKCTWGALLAVLLMGTWGHAAVIMEEEVNDTLAAAQSIDGFFSLEFSADIGDAVANTSTTVPHVTVQGTGNNTFDFFKFTVFNAGDKGVFDIDYAYDGSGFSDMSMHLFTAGGAWISSNHNSNVTYGAGGSTSDKDPFMEYVFSTPGVYVLGLAQEFATPLAGGRLGGSPVKPDKVYTLQVSLPQRASAPEPSGMLAGPVLAGLVHLLRRRGKSQSRE